MDGMDVVNVVLDEGAFLPEYAHDDDAGADIRTPVAATIPAHGSVVIDTGVHIEIPYRCTGFLKSRSGLNINYSVVNEGVIDRGYTGSIRVKLYNHGDDDYLVDVGDKISQIVILPYYKPDAFNVVDTLDDTERGDDGFGSTGK